MKSRPIQRTLSPNSPRLQYPIYGEYGFEEPVGKKKYSLKQSAIHQVIFNHPSPAAQHIKYQDLQKMRTLDYQAREYSESLANSKLSSNLSNNCQIYSPQNFKKMKSQNMEKSRGYANQKEANDKMGIISLKQNDRRSNENHASFSRNISMPNNYQRRKKLQDQRSFDSLDKLLRPHYQQVLQKNQIVEFRSKSPTFLNSHFH